MQKILLIRQKEMEGGEHKNIHQPYEYYKKELVPRNYARQCVASVYEIPPGKSAYPYHFHTKNEEAFFIISGTGLLRTPDGESKISAGDFLFFPANQKGAHKLTNMSQTETLRYLDFDTKNEIDVAFYPDSGKIGIWGKGVNQVYHTEDQTDYYKGED